MRDIRVMYSDDFVNWTDPEIIDFTDGEDEPLYTNNATIYPGSDRIFVGFPVRYCERKEWINEVSECLYRDLAPHENRPGFSLYLSLCSTIIFKKTTLQSFSKKCTVVFLLYRYSQCFIWPIY